MELHGTIHYEVKFKYLKLTSIEGKSTANLLISFFQKVDRDMLSLKFTSIASFGAGFWQELGKISARFMRFFALKYAQKLLRLGNFY
jgi:hypothetical protein